MPLTLILVACGDRGASADGAAPRTTIDPKQTRANPNKSEQIRTAEPPNEPDLSNMVWVEGGTFQMGSNDNLPDERPVHEVAVDGFWMETHEVTNEQFAKFIEDTSYKTSADEFENSIVFTGSDGPTNVNNPSNFWEIVPGASWRHPEGPDSDISDRMEHPVVHVSWEDATAYAEWTGKTLPTEAQWEYAAKTGLNGDPKEPQGNIYHGEFPYNNTLKDGYEATAPVGSFPPNSLGIYDMAGNVWEWCLDWYRYDYYEMSPKDNPKGPRDSLDPNEPRIPKKSIRGGSFLCHETYCSGFLPATRMKTPPTDSHSHTGFRCVVNSNPPE